MATTFKWSIEDWHQSIESGVIDNKPVELLEGEIVEMSPEGIEHGYNNRSIVKYLRQLLIDLAEVIQAQPITLDNSEPEPDVTIARLPEDIYKQHHSQVTEYFTGTITPQAFPKIQIRLDRLLLF